MTPWEERSDLLATVRGAITDPVTLFRSVDKQGPIARALAYAVIVGTVGTLLTVAWQVVGGGLLDVSGLRQHPRPEAPMPQLSPLVAVGLALLSPLLIALGAFVGAAIYHVTLSIVGGASHGYDATFRALAYAQTASLANVIPLCGGVIALVWTLVLVVIGLREVHETTTGKATIAVLLPLVACCGIVVLAVALPMYLASR